MSKKTRKGNGEGSIFRLPDGTWRGFITIGYDKRGKQLKKWRRGKTRRLVAEKLNKIAAESGSRLVSRPEKVNLADWLHHFAELKGRDVRPTTRAQYDHYMSKLVPALGHIELHNLTPLQVRTFYGELQDSGLSPSVRQHIHHFLKSAMRDALRLELIERNPLELVDAPKGGRVVLPQTWEPKDVKVFLEFMKDHRLYSAFYILLSMGMRVGEMLALTWDDLVEDKLEINKTYKVVKNKMILGPPKTKRGYRTIYLSQDDIDVLKVRQANYLIERDVAHRWEENNLIFATTVGTPQDANDFRRLFRIKIKESGVPKIRVHDLRHTYITLARDAGVDAEVVANRVGQDVRVTMQIYSKVTESRKRKAAKSLKELLNEE